jgi:hypothetical protein
MTTLQDYTKPELVAYAEEFGVELKSGMTKDAIVSAFEEDGVTVDIIKGFHPDEEESEEVVEDAAPVVDEPVDESSLVLVKMNRRNASYQVRGYQFTREHPFALVTEEDADYLTEHEEGFSMASPKEAREFYG